MPPIDKSLTTSDQIHSAYADGIGERQDHLVDITIDLPLTITAEQRLRSPIPWDFSNFVNSGLINSDLIADGPDSDSYKAAHSAFEKIAAPI